jgi:hypothetical protein
LYQLLGRCLQNLIEYENKFTVTNQTEGQMLYDRKEGRRIVFETEQEKSSPASGDGEKICETVFLIPEFCIIVGIVCCRCSSMIVSVT